ncbi:hypothetical protein ABK040_008395 [Willaertia magna]
MTKRLVESKRFLIILSFLFFLMLCIPIWWFSTGAYQSKFPHQDIQDLLHLSSTSLIPSIFIETIYLSSNNLQNNKEYNNLLNILTNKNSLNEIDESFHLNLKNKQQKENYYYLFIIYQSSLNNLSFIKYNELYLSKYRYSFIFINNNHLQNNEINKITNFYKNILNYKINDDLSNKINLKYSLTFNLINMFPTHHYKFQWKMNEKYIRIFTDKLSNLYDFTIDWRMILFGNFPKNSIKKITNQNNMISNNNNQNNNNLNHHFEIHAKDIQFLLNENQDWKFVNQDANVTSIQFLSIIPSKEEVPLTIRKYDGKLSEFNSFIIPRWGGVVLYNPNISSINYYNDEKDKDGFLLINDLDFKNIMEIFTMQLRTLLAIPSPQVFEEMKSDIVIDNKEISVKYIPSMRDGITDWEMDQLIRNRIQYFLFKALDTLRSMSQVVTNMPNVYVLDVVADLTRQAIHNILEAYQILQTNESGNYVNQILQKAKLAVYCAEKAFSHESMLSLLHFPNSQKIAVYLPLVLPVFVTVLVGFSRERRIIREKNIKKD